MSSEGLVASNFDVPAGEKLFDLLVEMNALLGSADPVLRDVSRTARQCGGSIDGC